MPARPRANLACLPRTAHHEFIGIQHGNTRRAARTDAPDRVLVLPDCRSIRAGLYELGYQAAEIAAIENAPPPVQPAIESIRPMGGNGPAHRLVHLTEGEVIGELNVPRLGVKAIVVQGDSQSVLRRAVGHIPDTSLPGQLGNVVLAGHRDTFFRPLRGIRAGDFISLKTAGGDFQYQVQSTTIVAPSHTEVLRSSGDNMLTLITCFPFYYVGAAPDRFVVRARQIGSPPG
jgi:sortase A